MNQLLLGRGAILSLGLVILSGALAFAQSGAATGTFIDPSTPNGVESNPQTFENVQPVMGSTPSPVAHPRTRHGLQGVDREESSQSSFVSPPDSMQKKTSRQQGPPNAPPETPKEN